MNTNEEFFDCTVRIRHRHNDVPANIKINNDEAIVELDQPEFSVSPGQSAVFYVKNIVLGGGIIREIYYK